MPQLVVESVLLAGDLQETVVSVVDRVAMPSRDGLFLHLDDFVNIDHHILQRPATTGDKRFSCPMCPVNQGELHRKCMRNARESTREIAPGLVICALTPGD
jgi:hypothetical protein